MAWVKHDEAMGIYNYNHGCHPHILEYNRDIMGIIWNKYMYIYIMRIGVYIILKGITDITISRTNTIIGI